MHISLIDAYMYEWHTACFAQEPHGTYMCVDTNL